jgi:hypothetical protein
VKNTGLVTIYDMNNGGAPLVCHRIDACEFLKHPRWSTSPDVLKKVDALSPEIVSDGGKTMQLKAQKFKTLQAMASKAGIPDYVKMSKAALVVALEAK